MRFISRERLDKRLLLLRWGWNVCNGESWQQCCTVLEESGGLKIGSLFKDVRLWFTVTPLKKETRTCFVDVFEDTARSSSSSPASNAILLLELCNPLSYTSTSSSSASFNAPNPNPAKIPDQYPSCRVQRLKLTTQFGTFHLFCSP
jgi:hypothetical protein